MYEYESNKIAERIKATAKEKGLSVKAVLGNAELNYNMMTMMRNSFPKANSLGKIADELNCSVDYLLGRTDNPNINR